MDWTTACPDWEERILAGETLTPCGPLFPAEARAAMEVFSNLRLVDVMGEPTIGQSSRPWMIEFAEAIFGSYDKESGRRLIREFALTIPKKNGKSTIAAGIMLTALIRNWRRSAEFLILAPTIEAANNAFDPAREMVRADPELRDLMHIQEHLRKITHRNTGASLKVVSAGDETVSGKKATGVLIDELWQFGKRAHAEAMFGEATGGLMSRPEGFTIWLTTQSDEQPAGVFRQKLKRWRDIRDGVIVDKRCLPILYEFPASFVKRGDHLRPENAHLVNPNFGLSVDQEFLTDKFQEAQDSGLASLKIFCSKHLNVEIGIGLRTDAWVGAKFWERRANELTLQSLLDRSDVVTIGIDGGGLDDLFGLCVLGRDASTRGWMAWCRAWCHEGVLEDRKAIASKLRDFEKEQTLKIVDDRLEDLSDIVDVVKSVLRSGKLGGVGVDPAGIGEFIDEMTLLEINQENDLLIGVPQGIALMNSIKTTERKLARGLIEHEGSELMKWCVGNLKIEPMATAIRATKQSAGDAKIDPMMGLFNAVFVMLTDPEPFDPRSVYEERGLLIA